MGISLFIKLIRSYYFRDLEELYNAEHGFISQGTLFCSIKPLVIFFIILLYFWCIKFIQGTHKSIGFVKNCT